MRNLFKISILFFLYIIVFGCATSPIITKEKNNFREVSRINVVSRQNDNGDIVIIDLGPNGPAEKSGIIKGDVILSVDGKKLIKDSEFGTVMNNKKKGDHVLIEIKRNEQILNFDIKPIIINFPPTMLKIGELLDDEKKYH
jgi:C-terminal processing protease CtpA/Prc